LDNKVMLCGILCCLPGCTKYVEVESVSCYRGAWLL